jgi:hypothetical protein
VEAEDSLHAEIATLRAAALPDYHKIAAKKAEVESVQLRITALREAAQKLEATIGAIEARAHSEPIHILALLQAVVCERMEAAVDRRRAATAELAEMEDEIEAYARANDQLVLEYENRFGSRAPGMTLLAPQLQRLREQEHKTHRNLIHGQVPARILDRAREIRADIERA